jgi:hypothetical protein
MRSLLILCLALGAVSGISMPVRQAHSQALVQIEPRRDDRCDERCQEDRRRDMERRRREEDAERHRHEECRADPRRC